MELPDVQGHAPLLRHHRRHAPARSHRLRQHLRRIGQVGGDPGRIRTQGVGVRAPSHHQVTFRHTQIVESWISDNISVGFFFSISWNLFVFISENKFWYWFWFKKVYLFLHQCTFKHHYWKNVTRYYCHLINVKKQFKWNKFNWCVTDTILTKNTIEIKMFCIQSAILDDSDPWFLGLL